MAIVAGTCLDPDQMLYPFSAGWVGKVYPAAATLPARQVARKLLPAKLTCASARLRRLRPETEAKAAVGTPNFTIKFEHRGDQHD